MYFYNNNTCLYIITLMHGYIIITIMHVFQYGHTQLSSGPAGFSGCYASHIVLRRGTTIVKIPPHVPDSVAAPINCALATVVSAVSAIPRGDTYRTALVQVSTISDIPRGG